VTLGKVHRVEAFLDILENIFNPFSVSVIGGIRICKSNPMRYILLSEWDICSENNAYVFSTVES
jgi:hypothetical protein